MVQSMNKVVAFQTKGNSFYGGIGAKHGDILMGDVAFEFYNERNTMDYIQIPYSEIQKVRAQVYFGGRYIPSFYVDTHQYGAFKFVLKDAKSALKVFQMYLKPEQLVRSRTLWQKIKRKKT